MKRPYLAALLLAGATLSAPAAHADDPGFEIDSYLTWDGYLPGNLYGYSYTAMPWNPGYALDADAYLECCGLDYNSLQGTAFYVEADVSSQVSQPGTYYVDGYHYYMDSNYIWYYIGQSYYELQVSPPKPTGEHSMGSGTNADGYKVQGIFNMWIFPADTNYSGYVVRENAYMDDGCWFDGSKYDQVPEGTGDSWWPVNNNSYGDDGVGIESLSGNAINLIQYYQGTVYHTPGCGFTGSQTMSMDGLGDYETHGVGLWLDPAHVNSYRGDGQIEIW